MKIIYINDDGEVSVVIPSLKSLQHHSIEAIAAKDVPAGKPFKIVADDYLPATREDRDAWTVDPSELTDGIGGESSPE